MSDETAYRKRNRQYGWPGGWDATKETLEQFFERNNCRIFEIRTSYGLRGFVAAERMEQTQAEKLA